MADATTDTSATVDTKVADAGTTATTEQTGADTTTSTLDAGASVTTTAPADWAPDWREKMAGGDAKELTRLQRFTSPVDVYKANRALETKLSQGQFKTALPENATPEQLSAFRKENGIPDTATGYDLADVGFEINDAVKPRVEAFTKAMHDLNAAPSVVKAALKVYGDLATQEAQVRATQDEALRKSSRDQLRAEWGGENDANFNVIAGVMDQYPALKAALADARLADGTPFGYKTDAMKELAMLARELNPLHTIVTSGGGDKLASVQDEMKAIEGKMGTDKYTESDRSRYVELVEVMESVKRKAA